LNLDAREASMTDDERQIRALIDSWIAASNAHDLAALFDMMTNDVVFMTPVGRRSETRSSRLKAKR
jgi:uncharacterized protein (TIGR02246 family)